MDILIPLMLATCFVVLIHTIRKYNRIIRLAKAISYLSALQYLKHVDSKEDPNLMTKALWLDRHPAAMVMRKKQYTHALMAIKGGVAKEVIRIAVQEGWKE